MRQNLVTKIEGLDACRDLESLDFYDNRIETIENLDALSKLKYASAWTIAAYCI